MLKVEDATRFRRLGILTIVAVYAVILMGGLVRASGAGMGCPDWPTCFGQWVPPLHKSELPFNYQEIYADRGYKNTEFNLIKTWTEYANRLVGVTIGILIFLTAWASRIYLKEDKRVFYLAFSAFLLVCFQGWLGSVVVASNLNPFIITLHMLLALVIVALLIYTITRSQQDLIAQIAFNRLNASVKYVLATAMVCMLLQIAMGAQVRQAVDLIANQHKYIQREYWSDSFPWIFYVHRSFSAVILLLHIYLTIKVYDAIPRGHILFKITQALIILILSAIIAGMSLERLGMPAIAQPIHLLLANLIFGTQFFLFMCLRYADKF